MQCVNKNSAYYTLQMALSLCNFVGFIHGILKQKTLLNRSVMLDAANAVYCQTDCII